MNTVLWVVGEPGVGKTSVVREIIKRAGERTERVDNPKFEVYGDRLALAGQFNGDKFDGADRLAIHQLKPAVALWADRFTHLPLTIFDGDKLSNGATVLAVRKASPDVRTAVVWLTDDPQVVADRRMTRGTVQNETWVAGRRTKARRFALTFPTVDLLHLSLQGRGLTPEVIAAKVLAFVRLPWL